MTTPTISDKLGDFFTVQLGPNRPVPIINGIPGQTVTLANQDLVNNVTISRSNTVAGGAVIPPLGSVTVDMAKTIWGTAPANTLPLLVFPGGGNWAPSPAQVAAQINALGLAKDTSVNAPGYQPITLVNAGLLATSAAQANQNTAIPNNIAATGVPALNLKSTQQIANAATITAGATSNLTAITGINQPAYNLHFTATAGASSTKPWYTVVLKWVDTTSGFVIQTDAFTFFMSGTSNVMSGVIAGPTDADQLQISVTNNDTVTMTLNTAFFVLSSRTNYTTDVCYQFWTSASMPAIPTFQLGPATPLPTQKILFSVNRTLGNGVTTTPDYALPVFSGQVMVHFDGTSSNNWDFSFTDQLTGTIVYREGHSGPPAYGNTIAIFPRAPVTLHISNTGSVSGTLNLEVTAL